VIAQRAADEDEGGEHQGVSLDDPLGVHSGGLEAPLYLGQRHVDDGAIYESHAGTDDGGGEYPGPRAGRARSIGSFRADLALVARGSNVSYLRPPFVR
jgi:hypothetical protein